MMKRILLMVAIAGLMSLGVRADDMKKDEMKKDSMKAMKKEASVKGWVSDSACAAHGIKNCNDRQHVADGAKLVVVVDKTNAVYTVENPDAVADHQGHRVQITGQIDDQAKTITVNKVAMLGK